MSTSYLLEEANRVRAKDLRKSNSTLQEVQDQLRLSEEKVKQGSVIYEQERRDLVAQNLLLEGSLIALQSDIGSHQENDQVKNIRIAALENQNENLRCKLDEVSELLWQSKKNQIEFSD